MKVFSVWLGKEWVDPTGDQLVAKLLFTAKFLLL